MKPAQKGMQKSAKSSAATREAFTEEERAAIRDRAEEMKAGKGEGETAVLAKIAEMREPDRTMAKRWKEVSSFAPNLGLGLKAKWKVVLWPIT